MSRLPRLKAWKGLPRGLAAGRLDLDHVGAQVGEQDPGHRASDHQCELEYANAMQWAGRVPSFVLRRACRHGLPRVVMPYEGGVRGGV